VEWALLEPLLPVPACRTRTGGRPEKWHRREIVDCPTDRDAASEFLWRLRVRQLQIAQVWAGRVMSAKVRWDSECCGRRS
jgi:hypothetical protein